MRTCFGNEHTSNEISRFGLNQIGHVHADVRDCMGCLCKNKHADSMPMACALLMMSLIVCRHLFLPGVCYIASERVGIL